MKNSVGVKFNKERLSIIGSITKRNAIRVLSASRVKTNQYEYAHFLKLLFTEQKGFWDKKNFETFDEWAGHFDLVPAGRTYAFMKNIVTHFSVEAYTDLGPRMLSIIVGTITPSKIEEVLEGVNALCITKTGKRKKVTGAIKTQMYDFITEFAETNCKAQRKRFLTDKKNNSSVSKWRATAERANRAWVKAKEKVKTLTTANAILVKENKALKRKVGKTGTKTKAATA